MTFPLVVAPCHSRTMKRAGIDAFRVKPPYAGGPILDGGRIKAFPADANKGPTLQHVLRIKALAPSGLGFVFEGPEAPGPGGAPDPDVFGAAIANHGG